MDTKILVTLRMNSPSERRRDLMESIRGMLEPTRVQRGCLSFRLYQDVEDSDALLLVEEWETQEALENHIRTDHQRRLLELLELLRKQPEIQFNTVTHVSGMDFIEQVLKPMDRDGPQQVSDRIH